MKTSELIKLLEKNLQTDGDRDVFLRAKIETNSYIKSTNSILELCTKCTNNSSGHDINTIISEDYYND